MSYQVPCVCGQTVQGARQRRHQVVPCPGCGRAVFVLPASPRDCDRAPGTGSVGGRVALRASWRMPLVAAGVSLLVLLAGFVAAWPYLMRRPAAERADTATLLDRVEAGRLALARGRFRLALGELNAALAQRDRHPHLLTPGQHRQLNQLHRQADLLADLLAVPLEEVARQAMLVPDPAEWALQFADYQGRGVLFDDAVRRDPRGRPVLAHHAIEVGDVTVRLALEDITLLHDLPLGEASRMIFGARLRDCTREPGGGWVFRFHADSGVLFTDVDTITAAACISLEPGLSETLGRQQRWLDERGGAPPRR